MPLLPRAGISAEPLRPQQLRSRLADLEADNDDLQANLDKVVSSKSHHETILRQKDNELVSVKNQLSSSETEVQRLGSENQSLKQHLHPFRTMSY